MKSKSRSKTATNLPSSKKGLDVFEFDEYDGFDDTRFKKLITNPPNWKLIKHTNIPNAAASADDDGFDMPLSTFTQNYRSSLNKRNRSQRPQDEPKPTTPDTKKLTTDAQQQQTNSSSTGYKIYKRTKKSAKDKSTRELVIKPTQDVTPPVSLKTRQVVQKITHPPSLFKVKENNSKNDVVSEKQVLRERIKNMLLHAGWTIDYRPRKNRAYMDAVYITPTGTGYWSIVKAYDAFQKMEEDNSKDAAKFTPLPDEVLGKLTRQTQKKMERQTNNKRKNEFAEDDDTDEKITRKSRKLGRSTLLVRGSDKGVNSANGFELYSGKRSILSWLIDSRVVDVSEHVEYINPRKTRTMQKGSITKDGILCGCCSKIVTFSKFEEHSGSKLGDPFPNIFLKSGKSLMQCQIDAWEKLEELEKTGFYTVDVDGDDPNDDTCGLCGDGGDLICCDGCPSTFHRSCLDIEMLPEGDWHCPNCPCKYCGTVDGKTEESLLMCGLCQKKYHESCRPELDVKPIESCLNLSFCGHKCHELYSQLQKEVGVKHELDSGFSWCLVHRSDSVQLSQGVECNSMLAVAMSVMDECFLPVNDRKSKTNLIRNVVFSCGSNLSRLNYSGFFTAILERGDEVVCAASIRIHGTQLAEMPFIGTRHVNRRQGMCRRLLSAIESALSSLHVEKLIIPAVAEHMTTWTDVFGFRPLEESHKQEMSSLNMLVFPGTDMLQKPLIKQDTLPEGNDSVPVDDVEKSELISSDVTNSSDKTASTDSCSQEPGDPGCSVNANKETLPSTSVKDEMPVSVVAANSSEMVSSFKIAGNNSVLVDDVEKSELISSDVKDSSDKTATTDSCSQEPGDPGCSVNANKETLPSTSPVKNEMPVSVVAANSSEMVSSIKLADDADSCSAQVLDVASRDIVSSDTPHEPKVLVSVDLHVESNVEETTTAKATYVPEGNNSVLVDDVEKSELISSDMKNSSDKTATTDTCSQEPGDPGCPVNANKETLPSTSVKNEMPVSVIAANSSEMVSSIKIADDADSRSAQVLDVASRDTFSSDTPYIESNVEETTTAKATNVPEGNNSVLVDNVEISELISSDVKDSSDKTATTDSGSQEPGDHGCSVDANKETFPSNSPVKDEMPVPVVAASSYEMVSSIKIADDADSCSAQVLDVASPDTVSSDTPCEPIVVVSVDSHVESNVEEITTAKVANDPGVPSNVEETTAAKATDVPDVPSNMEETTTTKATDVPDVPLNVEETTTAAKAANVLDVSSKVEETTTAKAANVPDVPSNMEETTTAKATDVPDVPSSIIIFSATPCESELQIQINEPVSMNLNLDTSVGELAMQNGNESNVKTMSMVEKLDMQNGCDNITDNISLEVQLPPQVAFNNNVSSDGPCEQESPSLVSHMRVKVEESSADVIENGIHAVKGNIKLSEGKKGLYESEIIAQETV